MDNNSVTDTSSLAESLGLLNIDNLKVFGETSSNSSSVGSKRVSERLNQERVRALETLDKCSKTMKSDVNRIVHQRSVANKENVRVPNKTAVNRNHSMKLNSTDYVPYRRQQTINISELITDESINLDSNSKVSFEPSEITGRSTHYTERRSHRMPKSSIAAVSSRLSVGDILASSFAPKARDLCGVLGERTSSVSSSTLSSRNNLQHTADMSKVTAEVAMNGAASGGGAASFSFTSALCESLRSEDFQPAEMMQSKLLTDEISWAQEFAVMPTTALSKEATSKAANEKDFEVQSNPNSSIMSKLDPNFSVGRFFNMRSEDIQNIVRSISPERMRAPIALVDDTVTSSVLNTPMGQTKTIVTATNNSITPHVDNRTYSKASTAPSCVAEQSRDGKHESKDSGNGTHESDSNLLSLSTIKKALINGVITDVSTSEFLDILQYGKRSKSPQNRENNENNVKDHKIAQSLEKINVQKENASATTTKKSSPNKCSSKTVTDERQLNNFESFFDLLSENKENVDPQKGRGTSPRDTISFTESLLDSSDLKELQRSIGQPRSPLSPLNIPVIRLTPETLDDEADIDDWPAKAASLNTSTCRDNGCPNNNSNNGCPTTPNIAKALLQLDKAHSPINDLASPQPDKQTTKDTDKSPISAKTAQLQPKPLSSTLLDDHKDDINFAVSPNLSKTAESKSSIDAGDARERTLVQNGSLYSAINGGGSGSPLSSPRSFSSSHPTSPAASGGANQRRVCDNCSPLSRNGANGDAERFYINARAGGRTLNRGATSPSTSESSANGVKVFRTGSSSTLRNGSGGVVRTISRCSSSSEFSHRDGKTIPLKVTTMELSWGSTRLRNSAHKSMQVKNIANKRLTLRLDIHGPGYQLVNTHNNMLTLQSQECRSIIISFCPTVIGAAIGRLSFSAPPSVVNNANCPLSFLDIPLYGYGGHSSVVAQEVHVGPLGMPFLQMGFLHELAQPLERTIKIYNKGPLQGFALATIDSVGLRLPRLGNAFEVQPTAVLIPPGNYATMRVIFRPQREDVRKITRQTKTVLTLANLRLVSGDEATRQRMRRLVQRMSSEDRAKLSPTNALQTLWSDFPAEEEIGELAQFREQPTLAFDMLSHMRVHEVALTINDDAMDETIKSTSSMYFPDDDETVLFRTVCSPSPSVGNALDRVDELMEEDVENALPSTRDGCWSVMPATLTFYLGAERRILRAALFICNSFKSRQYFEVTSNCKNVLQLTPSEGYVEPDGGHLEVEVNLQIEKLTANKRDEELQITVCMENERILVPVKIREEACPPERAVRNACA